MTSRFSSDSMAPKEPRFAKTLSKFITLVFRRLTCFFCLSWAGTGEDWFVGGPGERFAGKPGEPTESIVISNESIVSKSCEQLGSAQLQHCHDSSLWASK